MNEIYIDENYYMNIFNGNLIPSNSFRKYAIRASSKVKYFTFNQIKDIDDSIKNATCEIAELLFNQEQLKTNLLNNDLSKQKSSETVGPWSVTYVNNSQYQDKHIMTEKELNSCIYQICKEYLDEKLLYRGV